MDFGGGDIVAGANLAFFIYSHCFTEELAADTRYRDFRTDIRGFKDTLDKLKLLLCNARYRQQVSWPDREVIGDFLDTLHACEKLLERNKRFLLERSNAFENLQHYLSQQEQRIADLRIRIKFHTDKVLLLLDQLNFVLLGSIDSRADDILGLVEQSRGDAQEILHAVHRLGGTATEDEHFPSKELEQRFQASLLQDAPIDEEAGIPIAEGLAAACFAFQESENVQQPPQVQYLLFLKCRWLLERIKRGREYRAAKPGFYYVRVVNRLQQEIRTKARADVLTRLEDEQLLNLDPSIFRIWPLPAPIVVPDLLLDHEAPRPGEEEVARVSLASNTPGDGRTMTIYKWSATDFRTEVHASRRDEKLIVSEDIDTCKHRLVPRYALPIQATPRLELSIVLQQKTRVTEKVYAFDSTQDLYAVQAALTGYEVLHDQQIARCRIESMRKIDFSGSVQLWKPATYSPTSGYANGCDSLPTRLSSMSSGSKTSGKVSSRPASSVTRTSEGWELRKVEPPTIMVFAKYKESRDPDQLAIIYVKLEPKIGIESVQSPKEMSVTIAKSSGKKLEVRYLMCGSDIHHQPNTSTFDIFPLCASEDRPCVKTRETRYLSLCFDTPEETLRFRNQLQKVLDDRDDHLATLEGILRGAKQQESTQRRPSRSVATNASRRPSTQSASASVSLTSSLPLFDTGQTSLDATSPASQNHHSHGHARDSVGSSGNIPRPIPDSRATSGRASEATGQRDERKSSYSSTRSAPAASASQHSTASNSTARPGFAHSPQMDERTSQHRDHSLGFISSTSPRLGLGLQDTLYGQSEPALQPKSASSSGPRSSGSGSSSAKSGKKSWYKDILKVAGQL